MANVRQYVSAEGGDLVVGAGSVANEMLEQVGKLEEFRDVQVDLAELIIKIGEGLADRARQSADPKALAEAESAVPLHAQVAGEPALAFLNRSRLPAKLAEARAAVRKAQVRVAGPGGDGPGLEGRLGLAVYDAAMTLVDAVCRPGSRQRPDRADDRRQRADPQGGHGRPDAPAGRARRRARTRSGRRPAWCCGRAASRAGRRRRAEAIVFALADGFAYAIDGTTGAPLWQVPLGLASPFVPQPVPGEATALAFDARYNELVRFDARTGALSWRLALGEPVGDPPLVLGNQLVQVLPSGKLLLIALESGELQSTVNLGRPLARTPVHDESGQHLYVLGRQDCLFVLARDPLSCVAVVYLGHLDGSIPCSPARLGRFLVVPENDSLADSRLARPGPRRRRGEGQAGAGGRGLRAGPGRRRRARARSSGRRATRGATRRSRWATMPARRRSARWPGSRPTRRRRGRPSRWRGRTASCGWRRGIPGDSSSTPSTARSSPRSPLAQPGPALAPIQTAGKLVVMTFQDQETGGVALWGIDPETGVDRLEDDRRRALADAAGARRPVRRP